MIFINILHTFPTDCNEIAVLSRMRVKNTFNRFSAGTPLAHIFDLRP